MLALAIVATVLEVFGLIRPMNDIAEDVKESSYPVATIIGGLIGISIRSVVIIAIWVLYSKIE